MQDVLAGNSAIEVRQGRAAVQVHAVGRQGGARNPAAAGQARRNASTRRRSTPAMPTMAIESWAVFERLQKAGDIPSGVKFQISIPTPIAPTYNNMVPADRPKLLPPLTQHFIDEVRKIAKALPNDRIAIQWDVCQEVLAWENYYDKGPVDFRTETIDVLTQDRRRRAGRNRARLSPLLRQPADEHMVLPKDCGIMVEIANAVAARVKRPIQFFHHAGDQGAHRRRLLRAAQGPEDRQGHRTLSRPDPPQRSRRRQGAARRRAPPRARRRHRHRMRHGARRSGAAAGAARAHARLVESVG